MVPRLAATLALLLAATAIWAQDAKKVRIEFEGEGQREVWIQTKGKEGTLPDRTAVSGKAVEIETPEDVVGKNVYVHDKATGNVATRALDVVVKAGSWAVTAKDETHTFAMKFLVRHGDLPVSTAMVRLVSGESTRETLMTPGDKGTVVFHVVPFGDVEVSVDYKSGGEDKTLAAQVFESKPELADGEAPTLEISDDVETIAPEPEKETGTGAAQDKGSKGDEKEEPAKTSPFLTVFNMLIGLVVIGAICYAIWRFVKANPDQTADALKKAGVAMPGDPAAGPAPTPKKTGPPQQILLTDAAPTPAGDATVAFASAPAVKNPRLVKADGSLFLLQDGEQTVGRENADLTFAGESSVSRTHARLSRTGDSVTISDAGSTNGTFVNGVRLSAPSVLQPGDSIQFGAVQARYEE